MLSAELAGQAQSDADALPVSAVVAPAGHAEHAKAPAVALYVPAPHATQLAPGLLRSPL